MLQMTILWWLGNQFHLFLALASGLSVIFGSCSGEPVGDLKITNHTHLCECSQHLYVLSFQRQ